MVARDPTFRKRVLERYGAKCEICSSTLGLEADHLNGNPKDNQIENGMPLCGTCHNLKTYKMLLIDSASRRVRLNFGVFYVAKDVQTQPPEQVDLGLQQLHQRFSSVLEWQEGRLPFLFQDGKNGAYFTECHMSARELAEAFDLNAVMKPQEDPRFKYNRELQTKTKVFTRMRQDARSGRPFSDIIVEWNSAYVPEKPLKVLGGQHRARAIIDAASNQPSRYHGVKIFFALDQTRWEEVSRISNASIPIPKPLLDKQDEQFRHGNISRNWSQRVGLLGPDQDFADKVTSQRRFTVQILRSLVVNFVRGRKKGASAGQPVDDIWPEDAYSRNPGLGPDNDYTNALSAYPGIWDDRTFLEMGRNYLRLNNKQKDACSGGSILATGQGDQEKRKAYQDYMHKVMTPQVASAYAYTAGLLASDQERQTRLYSFQDVSLSEGEDPLNARQMSLAQDPYAKRGGAYRGLGMRQNRKEVRRLVELFLYLTSSKGGSKITKQMIELVIRQEHIKDETCQAALAELQMRETQKHISQQA